MIINPYAFSGGGGGSSPTPDILWWKLNDGSGTSIAADVGGVGTTNAAWVTGKSGSGTALDFNGTTGQATTSSTVAFGADIITICAWVYFDTTSGTFVIFESSANYNAVSHSFLIYLDGGNLIASIRGSADYRTESIAAPSTGAWTHLAFVLDNSTVAGEIKIYVNGTVQSTTVDFNFKDAAANFSTQSLFVAARNTSSFFLDSRMDDLRIYAGELSAADIVLVRDDPQ